MTDCNLQLHGRVVLIALFREIVLQDWKSVDAAAASADLTFDLLVLSHGQGPQIPLQAHNT